MTSLPLNGVRLRVRLIEVEVRRLKLDPENPRLHSAYLTHELPARPNEKQLATVLEQLPEFQALLDAITRNDGVFQPPLITVDFRVLEGNRRVTALRKLAATDPKNKQWELLTVYQLTARLPAEQERALRAKFHLENALPWDALSQLTEYLAVAERDGPDLLATMVGKFRPQIDPLVVAGRAVRTFAATYPEVRQLDLHLILVGLCGVRRILPAVTFAPSLRCIYTDNDEQRPQKQPFALAQVMKWLVEGRFTNPYTEGTHTYTVRPIYAPAVFREVRQAGEEALSLFLEEGGTLAKASAFLQNGYSAWHRAQRQALRQTQKYLDLLNGMKTIKQTETPDLYREAKSCLHRLEQLLGQKHKEGHDVRPH
jgi:hypothetical protein